MWGSLLTKHRKEARPHTSHPLEHDERTNVSEV
jgi:hypothetical protein